MGTTLDCGHAPPMGVCYACADAEEAATLARSTTFSAYVSEDGLRFTSWSGGEFGRIVGHGFSSRAGFGHGLHYWTVRTSDGRTWHGRNGGPGMALTIRAHKTVD